MFFFYYVCAKFSNTNLFHCDSISSPHKWANASLMSNVWNALSSPIHNAKSLNTFTNQSILHQSSSAQQSICFDLNSVLRPDHLFCALPHVKRPCVSWKALYKSEYSYFYIIVTSPFLQEVGSICRESQHFFWGKEAGNIQYVSCLWFCVFVLLWILD